MLKGNDMYDWLLGYFVIIFKGGLLMFFFFLVLSYFVYLFGLMLLNRVIYFRLFLKVLKVFEFFMYIFIKWWFNC